MFRPKLFLVDAFSLIFRAHFTFIRNPRITTTGLNTSAAYGFVTGILDLINREKPTHLGVAFESKGPTLRELEYEEYKAHRPAVPEDIISSLPYIFRFLEGMGIPMPAIEGYEADDVIGTLAVKGAENGFDVFMMTPDKDYAQLVSDHILLYRPSSKGNGIDIMDRQGVIERYGVPPERITDLLGLQGDTADNIPGVPKIGEKTALELITQFGSLENVITNVDNITKKAIAQSLRDFADQGRLSKKLATIALDVPIDFHAEDLQISEPDRSILEPLFAELEFRSIQKRIFPDTIGEIKEKKIGQISLFASTDKRSNDTTESNITDVFDKISEETEGIDELESGIKGLKTIEDIPHNYHLIDTSEKRLDLINQLLKQKYFCFDTETTSLDTINAELVGLSFSFKENEAYYIPFSDNRENNIKILSEFDEVFASEEIIKIAQNIKYDLQILNCHGLEIKGKLFDTMLAHYVLHAEMRHNMDAMSQSYLHYRPISFDEMLGKPKGKKVTDIREVPIDRIRDYACEDADVTFQLFQKLAPKVVEEKMEKLLYEVEIPLAPVLADMELTGIKVDIPFLQDYSIELGKMMEAVEKDVFQLAGETFNLNSPRQLGEIIFEKLKLSGDSKNKKTKTGQNSTGEQILQDLASKGHELPAKVLEYRHLAKLKSTYVDALPEMLNPKTLRVHTNFNQAVAITGRLSSNSPNLQNIPVKTDLGKEIRKAFIAGSPDHILVAADYSQIELRIMADLSKDEAMLDAFRTGKDIHSITASKVFGVNLEDVTSDLRRKAKMVNFGLIYGVTAFGLSQRLNVPQKEAKEIMENYFQQYVGIQNFMNECIEKARALGYAETYMGRKHYLRDINSSNPTIRGFAERNAINTPIQGSAADMIKLAMIRVHHILKKDMFKTKMMLQVHDELIFDVPLDELEEIKPIINDAMVNALPLDVPIEVNIGIGHNWLEAH